MEFIFFEKYIIQGYWYNLVYKYENLPPTKKKIVIVYKILILHFQDLPLIWIKNSCSK